MAEANTNGNGSALREKVAFPANVPIILELEHDDGTLSAGRYGDQYLYTFSGNKIAWLDPDVREKILATGARRGDEICVTKAERRAGNKRRVEWTVEKVEEEPPEARSAAPALAGKSASDQAPQETAPKSTTTAPAPAQASPDPMTAALIAALDAVRAAERHAQAQGQPIRFGPEDVRAIAATLYIQTARRAA